MLVTLALFMIFAAAVPAPVRAQADDPATQADVEEIQRAFQSLGMAQAGVVRGADGRISLVGEYENRDQVEMAFAAARAVVGLRRVAPTTPTNIKYRLKGFDTAFASTVGKMMQRAPSATPAAPPPALPPPRPSGSTSSPGASPSPAPSAAPSSTSRPAPSAPATPHLAEGSKTAPAPSFRRGARTYGIIVGVGKFRYLPEANGLEFADKDAFDFFTFLVSPQGGGVTRDGIRLLRQEEATSVAVRAAMRDVLQIVQAGDTVVLFAASHGLPNAMGKFDIVLHDTEFPAKKAGAGSQSLDFTVTNRATALSDDDLQGFVSQLALKDVRSVLVLDTCYSGKTFVSIPGYLPSRTRSLKQHQKEVEYSSSMSEEALRDLAQRAKDARTTRIVIVSASENEESLESLKSHGGLFTQTYIEALTNIHDYADAFDRAKPSVIRSARTVGHSQTPRLLAVPETAETKM